MVDVSVYVNEEEHIFEFTGCKCELKDFLIKVIDANKYDKILISKV